MNQYPSPFVGIDVSKDRLDVAVLPSGESWSTANQDEDIRSLVKKIQSLKPELIVLEATTRGLPMAMVNPRQASS